MNNAKIILFSRLDQQSIDEKLNDGSYFVEVTNAYNADSVAESTLDLDSLDKDGLDAFKFVFDQATFLFEQNAYIWKVEYSGTTVSLGKSFIRDDLSTKPPLTSIPIGMPLKVVFEIPAFGAFKKETIDLWYDSDFNPDDVDRLLAELGVVLSGNGFAFTVTAQSECKLTFLKPDVVEDVYFIDHDNSHIISKSS